MTRMRLSRSSDIEVDRTLESLSATLLILNSEYSVLFYIDCMYPASNDLCSLPLTANQEKRTRN